MSGRHAFNELTRDFTPERRARVDARKAELRAAMTLHELRRARAMTQKALGQALNVNQPAVAKLERRADMYVSNLRAYIEAVGGRLSIVAEFPQGSVVITNFSDAGEGGKSGREPTPEETPAVGSEIG
ncbi:MAG: XRE family transcriptional regulator [Defluviicoccus sp.]|nr:XRE family transcriptional regulator [Defluviicoccus sp.]MDE0386128.1 XRE family transcriptional regulator [Defluviicoccus sp.]